MRLGISSEEFWTLTPREFSWLVHEHSEMQAEELCNRANLAGAKHPDNRPYKPSDFYHDARQEQFRIRSDEEIALEIRKAVDTIKHNRR